MLHPPEHKGFVFAGLLLSFMIVAGQIGVQLDLLRPGVYAELVAAGVLSVVLFPGMALTCCAPLQEPRDVVQATG